MCNNSQEIFSARDLLFYYSKEAIHLSITFGGVSSDSLSLATKVQFRPNQVHAARSVDTQQVLGKNGLYIIDHGAFENYTQSYDCFFENLASVTVETVEENASSIRMITLPSDSQEGFEETGHKIANWLLNPIGYQRLEDSYEPDIYRMARYVGPLDIENVIGLNRAGHFTLDFDCKPQKFLKQDEDGYFAVCVLVGKLLNTSTGAMSNSTGARTTGLIPLVTTNNGVTTRHTVMLTNSTSTTFRVCYYDVNLDYIRGGSYAATTYDVSGNAPSSAYHCRIGFSTYGFTSTIKIDDKTYSLASTLSSTITARNHTTQISKPLIRAWIASSGTSATVKVNDYIITISSSYSLGVIGIDCETMNCYYNNTNQNKYVTITKDGSLATEYPVLDPGNNTITCTNIDRLEIYPRWWRI